MSTHELGLFDFVATTARNMSKDLFTKPDDDWTPVLFMEDAESNVTTMPVEQFMRDERTKDILADYILPQVIQNFGAKTAVMVLSAWTAKVKEGEDWTRPSLRPDREEILVLVEYTAEGVSRYTTAAIIRHEDTPPSLGEWESSDDVTGYDGRFVRPIVAAMKRVK